MSHSRQTVFRLFSCSQSADWCFHSHLNTTAAIVGACLWVCEHAHVCRSSNSSHWNGKLARPTSRFFFQSNGKHVDDDDKCQQHPHIFTHAHFYILMYNTSHLYIHTQRFLPFPLKWISNDDFIKTANVQTCQQVTWNRRVLLHLCPCSHHLSISLHLPTPHTLSTSWYIIQAQLLHRWPHGTGTGNAASSTISFLSGSARGVALHPAATAWRQTASKDLHTTSLQPHVWQTYDY